ncbi:MAG: helix-turn-helix transcriptional regulator [Solirubrobacteraceae bacterium]
MLEREAELARVDRVFDQVSSGTGAVVVVGGPAGIGKSELLAAVGAGARARGFGVLMARGSEFEEEIAFGVARQLFESTLRAASPGVLRRLLDGVARIGARALGVGEGEPLADRFAAIHGLYWLCANRAERGPLVVMVDDVQWADDSSLAWLGYLARRAGDLPLLLVLGLRSGDPGGERRELERLVGDRGVQMITLGSLSAASVEAMVRARLDEGADERFCGEIYELTHGNPLFVVELLMAAREEGLAARGESVPVLHLIAPGAVGTSVLARLGRLGAEAVALARAVAVLGAGAEVVLAARLAELDPVVGELTADRLAAAQILAPVRPLEFFHPLIGAAVLEDMAPGARRVMHRLAAALVEREGDGSLARVAAHLLACGPAGDGWVVERLRDAAREAISSGAPVSAASYLERALAETQQSPVRAELLLELGEVQLHAGLPGATERIREALELCTDARRRADVCLSLGRARFAAGDYEGALGALRCGLAELPGEDDDLSLELRGWCIRVALDEREQQAFVGTRLRGLIQDAAAGRTRTERVVLANLAYAATRVGARPHGQAARLGRRALADGMLLEDCSSDPGPYDAACYALLFAGEPGAAITALNPAIELSQRLGAGASYSWLSFLRAVAHYLQGDFIDALADLDSPSNAHTDEYPRGLVETHALTAMCLIERDDLTGAEEALSVPGGWERWTAQPGARIYPYALGRLRAAQGRLPEALDSFLKCEDLVRKLNFPNPAVSPPWRSDAALLAAHLGQRDRAVELVAEDLRLARPFGAPYALGPALRGDGLIEGGERGLKRLAEAVRVLNGSGINFELARTLTEYGAALRRAGLRAQARAELERALDLAHRLRARRIANQARDELIAAGAKPRRDAITGRDALTAGELRVARLAADGLTNREIAQALFVTTKTVTGHLSHIYRKLDITRRGQLASALAGPIDDTRERPSASLTIS